MLRHYLVLRKEGVPVFSFSNKSGDPHIENQPAANNSNILENETLFSGLLSSFVSFGKELGGSLKQIKLDIADLYMTQADPVIGVVMTDPSEDQEEISVYTKITEEVTNKFVDEYKEELEHWNGDVSQFNGFFDRISEEDIVKSNVNPGILCKKCLLMCCKSLPNVVNR